MTTLSLIAALPGAGCSFVFVDGPPARHRDMPIFTCTTSRIVPALDTLFTLIQAVRIGFAVNADDEHYEDSSIDRERDLALGIGLGALGAASMVYGYHRVSACRDARAELHLRWGRAAGAPAAGSSRTVPPAPAGAPPPAAPAPVAMPPSSAATAPTEPAAEPPSPPATTPTKPAAGPAPPAAATAPAAEPPSPAAATPTARPAASALLPPPRPGA